VKNTINNFRPRIRRTRIALAMCCLVCAAAALTAQQTTTTQQALERWNKEFAGPLENLNRQPNAGLVAAIAGRPAARALDLGTGEGRNAIYLAERGWDVTGVDLSDVAVAQARKNAAARGVKLNTVVADLDGYDFGDGQWDLVLSFYMHSWHDRTKTDLPSRIFQALKPGGLLVMEGFAKPEVAFGFDPETLAKQYGRFAILRNESVNDLADWDKDAKRHLVRFVARKPQ
jgi:SAM-dependent methyltransferase